VGVVFHRHHPLDEALGQREHQLARAFGGQGISGDPAASAYIVAWVSRLAHVDGRFDNPFCDHPLLLCSASTGRSGGAIAMPHARA
jgi:hypothetical protein